MNVKMFEKVGLAIKAVVCGCCNTSFASINLIFIKILLQAKGGRKPQPPFIKFKSLQGYYTCLLTKGQSGQGSSPSSMLQQNHAQISPRCLHMRILQPMPSILSSIQRSGPHGYQST